MDFKFAKIIVFTPTTHADKVREALAQAGCGHIGNYDYCSFSSKGTGRFRGLTGANPFIGKAGQIESVEEERIETICPAENTDAAMAAIKKSHPYEEPAVDIYPLLNQGQI
ncbi:hypothetical protein HZA39_04665 [Candidatus Peregrinibacteria bacterium]|nr:hypothetical protein [Candidatus Peregrinibacteria bacterium]